MVYTNVSEAMIKEPYQDIKKDKEQPQQESRNRQLRHYQQHQPRKDDKYGAWGPIFKNKENFINMHIC
ncbi:hypothetical protein EAI_15794 [Harpegnathos saltator]|uniref:Uncharacterized protein n=1 Tax=Harpegnathos saltator TaxID=610380 RepID=E2BBK5_HARSA|nr:hypothetical protein EAI_15794 [Harpegnathos saltator]